MLYVVNVDWFFISHRLELAKRAQRAGYEVFVASGSTGRIGEIESEGFQIWELPVVRASVSPLREAMVLLSLARCVLSVRPDVIHNIALKATLYGSVLGRVLRTPSIVNTLTGMGVSFTAGSYRALAAVIRVFLRFALSNPRCRTIVQNQDDLQFLKEDIGIREDRLALIVGSGVDIDAFSYSAETADPPVLLFASRMLREKGVLEFLEACRILRTGRTPEQVRFVLAGPLDPENPGALTRSELEAGCSQSGAQWLGEISDMPLLLRSSSVVVLPSYREGAPRVLLEAGSVGRPVVATRVPGCREVVLDGQTGLLVEAKNATTLAGALERLLDSAELRHDMGRRGRDRVVRLFSLELILKSTLALYPTVSLREPS